MSIWIKVLLFDSQLEQLRQSNSRLDSDHVFLMKWIVDRHPVRYLSASHYTVLKQWV